MSTVMAMPKIGVNMTEATIAKWLISEGDHVVEGQPVMEAETDKLTQEIPSTMSGTVVKFLALEGETVEVLQPVAVVESDAAQIGEPQKTPKKEAEPAKNARTKISPLAKKTAKQMGIDHTLVKPANTGERICKEDVLRYANQNKAREKTAKTHIPAENANRPAAAGGDGFTFLALYADMTEFMDLRGKLKQSGSEAGIAAFFALVASRALKDFPAMAAGSIGANGQIDIKIAADAEKGTVALIRDCGKKGILQIEAELGEKLERIKNGEPENVDAGAGAFAISDLGMFGIECFAPAIEDHGCCMLGLGAIMKKPVAVTRNGEDRIEIRPMMGLALSFGRGIAESETAAKFLQRLKHAVENPTLALI